MAEETPRIVFVTWSYQSGQRGRSSAIAGSLETNGSLRRLIYRPYRVIVIGRRSVMRRGVLYFLVFRMLLSLARKLRLRLNYRYFSELAFDNFASKNLGPCDIVLVDSERFPCVLKAARRRGAITVLYQRMIHLDALEQLLSAEKSKVGYQSKFCSIQLNRRRRDCVGYSDEIVTHSELAKLTDTKRGSESSHVHLVDMAVDNTRYIPVPSDSNPFAVLFVGHDALLKGVVYLLEAWRKLAIEDGQLLLAGEMPYELVQKYKSLPRTLFLGSVSDMLYVYQQASLLVHPAIGDAGPKVIGEAMACGLPVICAAGVGTTRYISNGCNGFVIPMASVSSLTEKILYFYRNPDERKRMGANARSTVLPLTYERHALQVVRILKDSYRMKMDRSGRRAVTPSYGVHGV